MALGAVHAGGNAQCKTMADPDLQIRGGGGHPHPEIRGGRS